MELYTLDPLLRRISIADDFTSLIWTERFSAWGDFELVVLSTADNRQLYTPDTLVAVNTSYRVMRIESVEDRTDANGEKLLTIKGRSLEALLEDRVVRASMGNNNWTIDGTPGQLMRSLFDYIVVYKQLSPDDGIPFLVSGNIMPQDTIPEPDTVLAWTQTQDTLYNALKQIGDLYGLGFRLIRNFDLGQLYFNVYSGIDRTTGQTTYPPVVFSPDLDNLQNTTELHSAADKKNVAYVFGPDPQEGQPSLPGQMVFATDTEVDGFDRRVLLVQVDYTGDPAGWPNYADQVGHLELSKHNVTRAFDGEFNQSSTYRYGVHYQLGDLVELRNVDGLTDHMRVTEQIFVADNEGERAYPTLSIATLIEPGTWAAEKTRLWQDLGPTEFWSTEL